MRSLIPTISRGALLAASGGRAIAYDCLSCPRGVYATATIGARPACTACGDACPDDVWRVMRTLAREPRAA